jgi:non-ribosomal peptide synthetase component F
MSLRLLHRFFEEGVARHAERPALRMGDRALSYRELDEQSNRLAGALISQGARPEVPIGVLLRRSIDTIVAALAVL